MKRVFFGVICFVVFAFGGLVVGGAIAGAIAGSKVKAVGLADGFAKGEQVGYAAGAEFGQKYGGIVLIGALVLSVIGTATGFLPGTKRKPSK
ncbi:hypothetical protein [Chitinolyticbacter albus]|uniref:hypothetical protein n=1 Tax=Chitinolyticbacter albus TaxID=2961951 RepID=UPI00210EE576|nr:hypothetical protein [Chitinolyticbacter albus]